MIKTRIAFKVDTIENWNNFQPELGEVCIYSDAIDCHRKDSKGNDVYMPKFKIGTGDKDVSQLSFVGGVPISESVINSIIGVTSSHLGSFTLGTSVLA